ncbi:MAG TPA: hypothetical protein VJX71_23235 [Methylomirabilota bacterium]|nr:hypothetical protein [Methylomirabilota bacterium]
MHSDIWYDLAIRELSELSDPATEKLMEAAARTLVATEAEAPEGDAADEATPAKPTTPVERPEVPSRG